MTGKGIIVPAPLPVGHALSLIAAAHDATGDEVGDQPAGRWTYGFRYAPENYTVGEILDAGCGDEIIDQPALPTPTITSATPSTTGGTLTAATYSYRLVARRGGGTLPSVAKTATTTGVLDTSKVVLVWPAVYGATSYDVYGRTGGTEQLMGNTTALTFTDTGSITPSGALPTVNDTAGGGDYLNAASVEFTPYLIRAEDRCSSFGFAARDYAGRALRQLQAVTPGRVEHEFWTGTIAQDQSYPNLYLTDGNAVDVTDTPGTAMTRERGFAALEQAMAECGYGPRGMIHCQPQVVPDFNGITTRRVGNTLLTDNDTIIVPGVGYPGTSPNGSAPATGKTWIYATPLVSVRLDRPVLTPDPATNPDWRSQALDRNRNDIVVRATRFAAATYDGPCVFAALITLTT